MIKKVFFSFFLFLFVFTHLFFAQEQEIDTAKFMKPPKNPVVATVLSAVIPGSGQIYNGKYWKTPLIYLVLAGDYYYTNKMNLYYKAYLHDLWLLQLMENNDTALNYGLLFMGITDINTVKSKKDLFRRQRDLGIFAFIGIWGLNVLDAYVDAQLSNFDVSEDLSLNISPFYNYFNSTAGIKLTFTFTPKTGKFQKL